MGHVAQLVDQGVQCRQQHLDARAFQHQRMAGVVDVLAGAGEMHELGGRRQLRIPLEAVLDPVLHRLDVVVGGLLDALDGLGVGLAEGRDAPPQLGASRFAQRLELGQACIGQRDEPFHLDLHAAVHQAEFAEQRAQRRHLRGIAAVERRERGQGGQLHGVAGSEVARKAVAEAAGF
jgi:hypothetical protein